jgi:PadR family transcriptional regulator, regulatory protein PadR
MTRYQADALRGSIELLALKTLSLAPEHGWGIGQRIEQMSQGVLEVNQGSLYPALQRLEQKGLIRSDWGVTENGRRARYYEITASGRGSLGEETSSWRKFSAAVEVVLHAT